MKTQPYTSDMAKLLKAEEIATLIISILAFHYIGLSWWLFSALFFAPDLSMIGYWAGPKIGAWLYNLFHHKAIALLILTLGYGMEWPVCTGIGIIFLAHASFDRLLGYGLKYETQFKDTHLGSIGK
jgi:hypothetical protein